MKTNLVTRILAILIITMCVSMSVHSQCQIFFQSSWDNELYDADLSFEYAYPEILGLSLRHYPEGAWLAASIGGAFWDGFCIGYGVTITYEGTTILDGQEVYVVCKTSVDDGFTIPLKDITSFTVVGDANDLALPGVLTVEASSFESPYVVGFEEVTELKIIAESQLPSSLPGINADKVRIYVDDGILNVSSEEPAEIFNLQGCKLQSFTGSTDISVFPKGVYLVKIGAIIQKVIF